MAKFKKIGKIHCVLKNDYRTIILCIGPDWCFYICLILTILGFQIFFLAHVCSSIAFSVAGALIFNFTIITYTLAVLSDPGIAQLSASPILQESEGSVQVRSYCSKCDIYTEEGVQHCNDCEVCIIDYDHHCPWTTKCVGRGNLAYFYCFLIGILLCFVYAGVLLSIEGHK